MTLLDQRTDRFGAGTPEFGPATCERIVLLRLDEEMTTL